MLADFLTRRPINLLAANFLFANKNAGIHRNYFRTNLTLNLHKQCTHLERIVELNGLVRAAWKIVIIIHHISALLANKGIFKQG